MSKRVRILLGGVALALMLANYGINVYSKLLPARGSYDGWTGRRAIKGGVAVAVITSVDPNGPAKDLRIGDEIIALNGIKVSDDSAILNNNRRVPPGTPYTLTIRQNGRLRTITLYTTYLTNQRFSPLFWVSALFLLMGAALFLLRPGDKQAWLLAMTFAMLPGVMGNAASNLPPWLTAINGVARGVGLLFLPMFAHFFLVFPENSPLLRRWPRLEARLYLPFILFMAPPIAARMFSTRLTEWMSQFRWFQVQQRWLMPTTILAYLIVGLIFLLINYRAASQADKRRLRVVMAGSVVGFFNLFLMPMGELTGLQARWPILWSWFDTALIFTQPLVPLSFVYAIVRHKVIPVSLIIRRGARYLLVKRGSVLLVMAGVCVALYFVLDTFFYYLNPASGRVVGIISAIVAIAVWQMARAFHLRMVAPKIDQLFFHQAYDAQQVIAELAESLRATTSRSQLLELVATKIQSALHAANVTILLRDDASGDYAGAYSCAYSFHNRSAMPQPGNYRLPRDSAVIRRLAESAQPIEFDGRDSQTSLHSGHSENGHSSALSNEELEALQKLDSALLLPIAGKEGLLGAISLGPHLGDLPFSSEDKRLLLSVGGPTSFALENIRLIERTIEDARRRRELEAENEQRARELEGARQLQLSMLPKNVPQLPHVEIAAYMKTATEVGGDYYDFHQSDNGTLTVVVGDATGHGLKAGTVVTAMKSLFRTFAAEPEIVPVFNQSSRVLKEMNLRSLFMGLTMIKLNGHRLKISAAGMPPVLIYRAETGLVEEVMIRAMPLGSISGYPYRERELTLSESDVVVMMSDGLPERFNHAGEMFDYSRTTGVLAEAATRSPREIIEHLVSAGENWANGRPQDDDVTFVVLKVK
ncbi:MAG: SpoIIE family protein phosphatase [Blastocatellales bacterium]